MKTRLHVFAILVVVILLAGCAKQEIQLPADAQNVAKSDSLIAYTTSGLEHYICTKRSPITYTKPAGTEFEAPSCDDNGNFSISSWDWKITGSVELNDYAPDVNQQLTGVYHFELFQGDDPNSRPFTDCSSNETDEPLAWGHSEFHVTVNEPKTVVIVCTLDKTVVSASFTVTPQ